ncbi:MAG: hypothetical protein ABIU96_04915 [Rhodanobacter sp.]
MRHFLTWAESAARLNTDDEGLRQTLKLDGGWRDLRTYLQASERAFLATLDGSGVALSEGDEGLSLYSRWDSDEPTRLRDGRTLDAWEGSDDFCEWEKQETSHGVTGYAAVYLLYGFLRVDPWCVKTAAQQGYLPGIGVTPPSWWEQNSSPVPLDSKGKPQVHFVLLDRGEKTGYRCPPKELQELWFQAADIEKMANASAQPVDKRMENSEPAKQPKPLDTRERITLLTIIGALAEAANLDLSQHNKAGEAVAAMLAKKGVTLSGRTIGEHLKCVREAMDSRKVK